MNALDVADLEGVRAWAQKPVDEIERQRRMAPLFDAVMKGSELISTSIAPDLMAGPTADVRRSILALEKSAAEFPQRMGEGEVRYEAQLSRVRRRTAALRSWLEAVS